MATTKSLANNSSTIEEYVDGGDSVKMKYPTLSLCDVFDGYIEFPQFNIYDDYIYELKSLSQPIELTDENYMKYYQNPKLLCHDIYKNSELDFIIMRINGVYDPKDFTFKKINMLTQSDMNTCLSKIYSSNRKMIDIYNQDNPTY